MTDTVQENLDAYIDQQKYYNFEGERGVQRFEDVIRQLGYSSLEYFLSDNPGAITAMIEWIGEQRVQDWNDRLEEVIDTDEESEE